MRGGATASATQLCLQCELGWGGGRGCSQPAAFAPAPHCTHTSAHACAHAPLPPLPPSLVLLDESAEVPLGIGRSWPHAAVGDGEAVAVDALLRNLGMVSGCGQRLALSLPLDKLAATGGADVGAISGAVLRVSVLVACLRSRCTLQASLQLSCPS